MQLMPRQARPIVLGDLLNMDWFDDALWSRKGTMAPVEIESDESHVYVKAELPGMNKKDIQVEFENGVLTISGEKKVERKGNADSYRYTEITEGQFKRNLRVGNDLDFGKAIAEYVDGVLKITFPKTEEKKAKKLSVA